MRKKFFVLAIICILILGFYGINAAKNKTFTSPTKPIASAEIDERLDPHGGKGYSGNRSRIFGRAWLDVDGNGCDTRNDILARDLKDVVKEGDCKVLSGVLYSPYSGDRIDFLRGEKTSSKVQIDHVIPLGYAYRYGGWRLAEEGKKALLEQFANDPLNLLAVEGSLNGAKSDKGPSQWLPPTKDKKLLCAYGRRTRAVFDKYYPLGFSMAKKDLAVVDTLIEENCF